MIDQSHIDITSIIGVEFSGNWHKMPCPFCGGDDRFYISRRKNVWGCRNCAHGYNDPLAFVARRDGHDLNTRAGMEAALAVLRIDPATQPTRPAPSRGSGPVASAMSLSYALYSEKWQQAALNFTDDCYADRGARDYVMGRGIEPELMRQHKIGHNRHARAEMWGEQKVWLPSGVVIPTRHLNMYWRIRFRRTVNTGASKYIQVAGGGNALFYARPLTARSVAVLVEGEFDALALASELMRTEVNTGNTKLRKIVPVATCGTTQSRVQRSLIAMATAQRVLVAFDAEDAAEKAAEWWITRLPNAVRLVPTDHDVNDMVLAGRDVVAWLRTPFEKGV